MGTVTLSFDNGPDAAITPRVLDVLASRDVKTTFFVLGSKLESPACRRLAERAVDEGHWLGNHSFSHKIPLGEDPRGDAVEREIADTERLIGRLACEPKLFRPFGGGGKIGKHLLSSAAANHLVANRYTCVLWNSVPEDWINEDAWVQRALRDCHARPWTLVVLHDFLPIATGHLDGFIGSLLDAGHRIVQEFPPDCIPIKGGCIVQPISDMVSETQSAASEI